MDHHSEYLESKRNKDTNTEKPLDSPRYASPETQKHNVPSDSTPKKWPEGTICLAGEPILYGIVGLLRSIFVHKIIIKEGAKIFEREITLFSV